MKLIVIESPYGSPDPAIIAENETYVRRCMAYALSEGCAPYASHALYTQPGVLRDDDPDERKLGMKAGQEWSRCAEEVWVCVDRGVSSGMVDGVRAAHANGQAIFAVRLDTTDGPQRRQWFGCLVDLLELLAMKA